MTRYASARTPSVRNLADYSTSRPGDPPDWSDPFQIKGNGTALAGGLSYRASPDNSLIMGTHRLSGQVVLIVQKSETHWEIALPPKIAVLAPCDSASSLPAAKRLAETAFSLWDTGKIS
ncbi:MAG: hypothetical protein ACOY17_03575 [Pseudomonadota bacterium]|jgi:hypothetical protein